MLIRNSKSYKVASLVELILYFPLASVVVVLNEVYVELVFNLLYNSIGVLSELSMHVMDQSILYNKKRRSTKMNFILFNCDKGRQEGIMVSMTMQIWIS